MNLEYLKSEKEKVEKEIKKAEEYLNGNYSQYDKDGAYDDLQELKAKLSALNLGIQAVENTIKDEIEFLQSIMCFAMFRELTERLDKLRNQLQKQKEDTK